MPIQKKPSMSTEKQLATAIDELLEHFVLFDAEDRIILANKAWKELNKDVIETTEPGVKFEDHLRAAVTKGLVPDAVGREEDWIRERMDRHRNPRGPFEVARQDGTWIMVHEQRLPNNTTILIISDITKQKKVEEELRASEERFQAFTKNLPAKMHIKDAQGRYLMINPVSENLLGLSNEEVVGKTVKDIFPQQKCEVFDAHDEAVLKTGLSKAMEEEFETSNGQRTFLTIKFPVRDANGNVAAIGASGIDISERKQAEEDLRVAAIALDSHEAIAISDANKTIIKVNQSFSKITGYSAEEAIGRTLGELLKSGRHDDLFYQAMKKKLQWDQCWEGEIWYRHKNGGEFPHRLNFAAVTNDDGHITHYVASFNDISQQKEAEETIHNLAFFDSLTELPNRRMLQDRLQHTLASSSRNRRHGAILFMDLDNFKELNDTKGHDVGDMLLVEIARRLQACVRGNDTVSRLGGDEFVVVLNDLNEGKQQAAVQAEVIAEEMRESINQSVDLRGFNYQSSSSIGISMFQGDDVSAEDLLKRADTAMYQAKQSGRNAIHFFDPATHAAMEARIVLEADLRTAIAEDQFKLFYQMQVDNTGSIIGAEALLRWQHPQQGLISPDDFIPLAEENGLILPIGHWVLETACAQLKAWETVASARHLQLAINVSARQFHHPDFVQQVCTALEKTAIDPSKLKLEFTESLMLDNVSGTIIKMRMLKKMGISFCMNDFGTGYSSLAYLTQLLLDQIKVDKSFVRNIGLKPSDDVIVQTIIGMAKNLGMDVVAVGVETMEQRDFLFDSGCFSFQGYLFGWAVPLEEFEVGLIEFTRGKPHLSRVN